jgi:hypothetical protein
MFDVIAPIVLWLSLMPAGILLLVVAVCLVDDAALAVARRRRAAKRAGSALARALS